MKVRETDEYNDINQVILDGILNHIDVEDAGTEIFVPQYDIYKLSIDELINSDDTGLEIPRKVLQVAIRLYFDV